MAIPVSTTFLILTCFALKAKSLGALIMKSLLGYVIGLGVSLTIYFLKGFLVNKFFGG